MAFRYDKLSYGFHPDYCSTCPANDCHGACICPTQRPAPRTVCDGCGGSGCPKCGCEPAPQQTFLSHTRVSFPKCTCDPCPKRCPKCCRRRKPCDCLPSEECNYNEKKDEEEWSDEDVMTDDRNREEAMEVDDQTGGPTSAAGDGMVNSNNSEAQCSCDCTVTPMDTSDSVMKARKPISKVRRKRKVVKRIVRRKPSKKRVRRRSRSQAKVKGRTTKCKTTDWESKEAQTMQQVRFKEEDVENEPEQEPNLVDEEALEYEASDFVTDPSCKVTQIEGPCIPPPPQMTPSEKEDAEEKIHPCDKDCEKPCLLDQFRDPCNPRSVCVCKQSCQKEFHMSVNGACQRCKPISINENDEVCKDCGDPSIVIVPKRKEENDESDEDDDDSCDQTEDCGDYCVEIFGKCPSQPPCQTECNTGECENPCIIM